MKVLLKGYYGFGNLGDDILMKASWELLHEKWPGAEISIQSNFNNKLQGFDRQRSYNTYIFRILNSVTELTDWTTSGSYDLVVDGGGGIYFDYSRSGNMRFILNKLFSFVGASRLSEIDKMLRRFLSRQKKIQFKRRIGLGLGVGPYSESSTLLYDHLSEIGSTDSLFVRDRESIRLLELMKYRGEKIQSSDLAFFTQYWLPEGLLRSERKFEGNLGIILLDWHERNEERFSEFVRFATLAEQENIKVTFFSFDENNDKEFIRVFAKRFPFVVWQPDKNFLHDFLKQLSKQDLLFSARAHGVIIGSILGIPTISLGTSKKLVEISKLFRQSNVLIEEPFTAQTLHDHFHQAVKDYPARLQALATDLAANYTLADSALRTIKNTL